MGTQKALLGAAAAVVIVAGAVVFIAKDSLFGPSGPVVVYEVAGSGLATISYVKDTEIVNEAAELPWRKEVEMTIPKFMVTVKAGMLNGDGPLSCSASVDGKAFVTGKRTLPKVPMVSCDKAYP